MVSQTVYFTGMVVFTLTSQIMRCTIEHQYSCQYSYEYLSKSTSTITLELTSTSTVRVPEIQYSSTASTSTEYEYPSPVRDLTQMNPVKSTFNYMPGRIVTQTSPFSALLLSTSIRYDTVTIKFPVAPFTNMV